MNISIPIRYHIPKHPPFFYGITVAILCIFHFFTCSRNSDNSNKLHQQNSVSPRIISFAPSITETVFALNAQDHLVGVTDFCKWPVAADALPKVGGYINPNYEQILRLKPDIALVLREHETLRGFLEKEHITAILINNHTIDSILASIRKIGEACKKSNNADSLISFLQQSLTPVTTQLTQKPGILFCVGRSNPGSGTVNTIYCAGPRSFYSELLERAGGVNACTDSLLTYPSIGLEGIIRMQPDIIIDVMAANKSISPDVVVNDWNTLSMLPAVKNKAVFSLSGNYISIPGPRINLIFNDLHRCITEWADRSER